MDRTTKQQIFAWSLYDWANSVFTSIVLTFIFSAYFTRKIAIDPIIGTTHWGVAIGIAGLFIAFLGPIFGSIADYGTSRKPWLALFSLIAIICCALLWFAYPRPSSMMFTLICVAIGTIAFELGNVFYNALLPIIAPPDYLGRVSGWGWGAGYVGGLICLIIVLLLFVDGKPAWLNTHTAANIRIIGPFIALWFAIFAAPLFLYVSDRNEAGLGIMQASKKGLSDLLHTIKSLPSHNGIFLYLIAHMIYADGLNTLFAFGGIYAAGTFHMSMSQVVIFGIILNLTAGLGAFAFAWCDDYFGSKPTILFGIVNLIVLSVLLLVIHSILFFWILAALLGIFVGPVQAASRSLMARLSPPDKITEMFGLYAFSGKITAFIGPWVLAILTDKFASQRIGMSSILAFFIVGAILLLFVREPLNQSGV